MNSVVDFHTGHKSAKFAASLDRVKAIAARRHGPQETWMLVAVDRAGAVIDHFSPNKLKWDPPAPAVEPAAKSTSYS